MQRSSAIPSLAIIAAFVAGVSFACQSEVTPNSDHCYHAAGDQTCAERYGSERPFCVGAGEGCDSKSENYGCVAELPPQECYSPCGISALSPEDSSCLETAEETADDTDADGESGDAEGDGDGDGDGDPGPVCGDAELEGDEECDDGNQVDDDECSNACVVATCGDGVVQAVLGETCDDGNTVSGDSCSSSCVLPGTVIWEKLLPVNCDSYRIALAESGRLYLGCRNNNEDSSVVLSFDGDGNQLWDINTIGEPYYSSGQWLAAGPDNVFAVAGRVGIQGQIRHFDADGNYMWSKNVPVADSRLTAVGFDGQGNVVGVGWAAPLAGFAYRYDPSGDPIAAPALTVNATTFNDVEVNSSGRLWIRASGGGIHEMISVSEYDELIWTKQLTGGSKSVAIDSDGNVFAVPQEADTFAVTKIGSNGIDGWAILYDNEGTQAAANGVAALPTGGVLVAGMTNGVNTETGDEGDGLLSWYGPHGENLLRVELDGDDDVDDDEVWDVAVSAEGYAVAVVTLSQEPWLIKFVI